MDPRPQIFVSAVAAELHSAHEKVAATLSALQFIPVSGDESAIDGCAGFIQIVGHQFGTGEAQQQADAAAAKSLPVWHLVTSDGYPADSSTEEDIGKKLAQAAYRLGVRNGHPVADIKDIELAIYRLQDELDQLRPLNFQRKFLIEAATAALLNPPAAISEIETAEADQLKRSLLTTITAAIRKEGGEELSAKFTETLGDLSDEDTWINAQSAIASALAEMDKAPETEPILRQIVAARRNALGEEHPQTLEARNNLASLLSSLGKEAEAEEENRALLELSERMLGTDHPYQFFICFNLGVNLLNQSKYDDALIFANRALDGWTASLGTDHPNTLDAKALVDELR